MTGKTWCTLKGIGFNERTDKYYVHFINNQGAKVLDVIAPEIEWIDTTTIKVMTPDFMQHGPKECTVRIAINEGD
jgi:hypothetical protein